MERVDILGEGGAKNSKYIVHTARSSSSDSTPTGEPPSAAWTSTCTTARV